MSGIWHIFLIRLFLGKDFAKNFIRNVDHGISFTVGESLKAVARCLFEWFSVDQMKLNPHKSYLLLKIDYIREIK